MKQAWREYGLAGLCALLICAALLPTLGWVELSSGSEQLVVAAVLETQREGTFEARWLPSLNGELRVRKPPLTTWAGMLAVSTDEARRLATGEVNDAAFRWAAIKLRTVALGFGCLLLVGTYSLGRVLLSTQKPEPATSVTASLNPHAHRIGLTALLICGSSFFWFEQSIRLTTDLTLAAFVVWANVGLAVAILQKRLFLGAALAGVMTGLAFMCKGPVALAQTAAPAAVWVGVLTLSSRG